MLDERLKTIDERVRHTAAPKAQVYPLTVLVFAFFLASCSFIDDYDIDLMQDAVASAETSSSIASANSTGSSSDTETTTSSSRDEETTSSSKIEDKSSSSSIEKESSSSKGKDTIVVIHINPNSSSEVASCSSNEEKSSSSKTETSSSSEEKPVESSSSSAPAESSSSIPSSSSETVIPWTCGDSTMKHEDREYKTVVIKERCWMKENLDYEPNEGTTMCYGNENTNCATYGRLYDYKAASSACPTGWRLPTSAEYVALAEFSLEGATLYEAGMHFKATSGWNGESGDDLLGFSALPGGKCDEEGACKNIGKVGYWWTSSESVASYSHYTLHLTSDNDSYSAENKMENDQYVSIRCVKK